MKLHALVLSLALVLVFAACAQPQQAEPAPDTTAADTEAIRTFIDQFVDAWNVADNAALGPMLSEDVVLMHPEKPVQNGRDVVLETMAEGYDITLSQQSATVDEVIVLGDHAYTRGTWNVDPTPAAGLEVPAAHGKWSTLLTRGDDGAWQISRWMWNQPAAPGPAGE